MNPIPIKKEIVIAVVILVLAVAVVALVAVAPTNPNTPNNPPIADAKPIPKFASCSALKASFEEAQESGRRYGFGLEKMLTETPMAAPSAASGDSAQNQGPAYSQTNVQVEGVDEADIVKTNGEYIFTLSKGALTISKAFPAEEAQLVSYTPLNEADAENAGYSGMQAQEMFLDRDFVLVFGNQWKNIFPQPLEGNGSNSQGVSAETSIAYPWYGGNSVTVLQVWDVSDKSSPRLVKSAEFEGSYVSSRKIGSTAFFVVSTPPYRIWMENVLPGQIVPQYREKTGAFSENDSFEPSGGCADIGYLEPNQPESFITIGSLDMANPEAQIKKETIAGSGQNVYASMNNLYVGQTQYDYPNIPDVPVVKEIAQGISEIVYPEPRETTVVHKFSLANSEIAYLGFMQAPGHILNQFSMDEFDNHFRIATTIGEVWNSQKPSMNNIYVFDSELKKVGSLEDLAPGEKIYSARFMGNRGYLVTFKKIDPFFVIDLSNPSNPAVLGKLKIPGYSDYLHPFDETHIIGLGKNTIEASEELVGQRGLDFAWYQGIKIALFDVTDVANPTELFKVDIGDRGTESLALHDHKAFLFDREKELLVIPVTLAEIPEELKQPEIEQSRMPQYGEFTFSGAFVYNLSLENGFQFKGRITHDADNQDLLKSGYYYYGGDTQIQRSLYIGNVLYTISEAKILANDLSDLSERAEIPLEPPAE